MGRVWSGSTTQITKKLVGFEVEGRVGSNERTFGAWISSAEGFPPSRGGSKIFLFGRGKNDENCKWRSPFPFSPIGFKCECSPIFHEGWKSSFFFFFYGWRTLPKMPTRSYLNSLKSSVSCTRTARRFLTSWFLKKEGEISCACMCACVCWGGELYRYNIYIYIYGHYANVYAYLFWVRVRDYMDSIQLSAPILLQEIYISLDPTFLVFFLF